MDKPLLDAYHGYEVMKMSDWSKSDETNLMQCKASLDSLLAGVDIPVELLYDCDNRNDWHSSRHTALIDGYYSSIIACVKAASTEAISPKLVHASGNSHSVPGWNEYVRDKHEIAR